jgi:hypothetical protein
MPSDEKKTADAVLVGRNYPAPKPGQDRLLRLIAEFRPILGSKRVYLRHVGQIQKDLLTAEPDSPTCYFPSAHPYAGRDRYDWTDRGDGVMYGALIPDDADPAIVAEAVAAQEADLKAFLASPEGQEFMKKRRDRLEAFRDATEPDHAPAHEEIHDA